MFNVCTACGNYSSEKQTLTLPARAVCADCGFQQRFRALPLFAITGASGSGKTTIALQLMAESHDFVVLDQDILWCDYYNNSENDFYEFRNVWLRLCKNIHQSGRSVVLFGSAIPEQYEKCSERRYFQDIHYSSLVCEPDVLKQRLTARPQWRNSGDEANLARMVDFNNWLRARGESQGPPPLHLIDTTHGDMRKTTEEILKWLRSFSAKVQG